mmetsp:Transcript_19566/g.42784  ORF Transcript_19566/g.42784 Transcript_19566/m.42784 type:complete len:224 (-) Transcript_19566:166-837(-)
MAGFTQRLGASSGLGTFGQSKPARRQKVGSWYGLQKQRVRFSLRMTQPKFRAESSQGACVRLMHSAGMALSRVRLLCVICLTRATCSGEAPQPTSRNAKATLVPGMSASPPSGGRSRPSTSLSRTSARKASSPQSQAQTKPRLRAAMRRSTNSNEFARASFRPKLSICTVLLSARTSKMALTSALRQLFSVVRRESTGPTSPLRNLSTRADAAGEGSPSKPRR